MVLKKQLFINISYLVNLLVFEQYSCSFASNIKIEIFEYKFLKNDVTNFNISIKYEIYDKLIKTNEKST